MKPLAPGAVASLICGILALMLCAMPVVGLGLGIAAILCARRARRLLATHPELYLQSGVGSAGLICGVIGTVFSALSTVALILVLILATTFASALGGGTAPSLPTNTPML